MVEVLKKSNKKDMFSNVIEEIKKPQTKVESIKYKGISNSRTKAITYEVKMKNKKMNKKIFIKFIKIKSNNNSIISEYKIYKITNKLIDKRILNNMMYNYNDLLLRKDIITYNKEEYIILAIEHISNTTISLNEYLKKSSHKIPECIIFQLLYVLDVFDKIKFKHMDLHEENIYIEERKKIDRKYIKYEVIIENKIEVFYIYTSHNVKIIDFDGSIKNIVENKRIQNNFRKPVNNPKVFTGQHGINNRVDILKLIHTFMYVNPKISNQLWNMGLRSNTKVPFEINLNINRNHNLKTNEEMLKNYGFYVYRDNNKKIRFQDINNKIVWSVKKTFKILSKSKVYSIPHKYSEKYSQVNLYLD